MSMVEVRTADLIGLALDWAVAKTEKASIVITCFCGEYDLEIPGSEDEYGIADSYSPSTDWSQGGPLLAKFFRLIAGMVPSLDMWPDAPADLLPWAMRAIVQFELGDVVSVPAELVSQ